jgi:hypothetical protein
LLLGLTHGPGRFGFAWASALPQRSTLPGHGFDLCVKPCVSDRLVLVEGHAELPDRILIERRSKQGSISLFPTGLVQMDSAKMNLTPFSPAR